MKADQKMAENTEANKMYMETERKWQNNVENTVSLH